MHAKRIGDRLNRIGRVTDACDLDLLLFFHRHPRAVLTSERVALYVGHDLSHVTKSLDSLISNGLLTRVNRPSASAAMYVLASEAHAEPRRGAGSSGPPVASKDDERAIALPLDAVLHVLNEGPRCVACIAHSANTTPLLALNALGEIAREADVTEKFGRCDGCDVLSDTHEASPPNGTPGADFSGFGILVVDDHEDTMDLYAAILEEAGAIVQRATNLLDALNLFQQVQIRLVVTDIAMPGGSGWDVLREVRRLAPLVPFVAVTGQLFPDGHELVDRGFDAALLKPIDAAELLAVVGELIHHEGRV